MRGLTNIMGNLLALMITISLVGSAFFFLTDYYKSHTIQILGESPRFSAYCKASMAEMELMNIGANEIFLTDPPADYRNAVNEITNPSFEENDLDVWEIQDFDNDIMLLLDRSGSMSGTPFEEAKEGAIRFLDFIDTDDDRVGIISFSGRTTDYSSGEFLSDLESPLTSDTETLMDIINDMDIGLYTGIASAIRHAITVFDSDPNPGAIKSIVLLTDGEETFGGRIYRNGEVSDPVSEAELAASRDIKIYTIGYGPSADEDTLINIADATEGTYHYAETDDLEGVFSGIALDITSGIDDQRSMYGNRSLRIETGSAGMFYSRPRRIDYEHDTVVSMYTSLENLVQGSETSSIYFYGTQEKAENYEEDYVVELNTSTAPFSDANFTRHTKILNTTFLSNSCDGGPCPWLRIGISWPSGNPDGTSWIDDLFVGPYMPYFDNMTARSAELGDISIFKKSGDGDLFPYVSSASVESRELFRIRDANCIGLCTYDIVTSNSNTELSVYCKP